MLLSYLEPKSVPQYLIMRYVLLSQAKSGEPGGDRSKCESADDQYGFAGPARAGGRHFVRDRA